MLKVRQILVSALGLCVLGVALGGCGQKGPLYLPTDPAASNRMTLPSLLTPSSLRTGAGTPEAAAAPAQAASSAASPAAAPLATGNVPMPTPLGGSAK